MARALGAAAIFAWLVVVLWGQDVQLAHADSNRSTSISSEGTVEAHVQNLEMCNSTNTTCLCQDYASQDKSECECNPEYHYTSTLRLPMLLDQQSSSVRSHILSLADLFNISTGDYTEADLNFTVTNSALPIPWKFTAGLNDTIAFTASNYSNLFELKGSGQNMSLLTWGFSADTLSPGLQINVSREDLIPMNATSIQTNWTITLDGACEDKNPFVSIYIYPVPLSMSSSVGAREIDIAWDTGNVSLSVEDFSTVEISYRQDGDFEPVLIGNSSSGNLVWSIPAVGFGTTASSSTSKPTSVQLELNLIFENAKYSKYPAWSLLTFEEEVYVPASVRYAYSGSWSVCNCSQVPSIQERSVLCQYLTDISSFLYTPVSLGYCQQAGLNSPTPMRLCSSCTNSSAEWVELDSWSTCNTTECGVSGSQVREYACIDSNGVANNSSTCGELTPKQRDCTTECDLEILSTGVDDSDCVLNHCFDMLTGRLFDISSCGKTSSNGNGTCERWNMCSHHCGGGWTSPTEGSANRTCNTQTCSPVIRFYDSENGDLCITEDLFETSCSGSNLWTCDSLCSEEVSLLHHRELVSTRSISLYASQSNIEDEISRRCPNSDVITPSGECCSQGSVLDNQGECCESGFVDACGSCDGENLFLDLNGECCDLIDAAGFCCSEGIDRNGVCAGTATYDEAADTECGNDLCEIGEACDGTNDSSCCKADCPFSLSYCPAETGPGWSQPRPCGALGACLISQGTCDCFSASGRASITPFKSCVDNSTCASGYTWTSKGCIEDDVLIIFLCTNSLLDDGETGSDCGGFCPFICDGTLRPTSSPDSTTVYPSTSGNIATSTKIWVPVLGAFGGLIIVGLCALAFINIYGAWKVRKLIKKKPKVNPDLAMLAPTPGDRMPPPKSDYAIDLAGFAHDDLINDDSDRKHIAETSESATSKINTRLTALERREELLSKEVAIEGWLDFSHKKSRSSSVAGPHLSPNAKRKGKRSKFSMYGVLRPVGDLLCYKDMIPSGFGNIHMNLLECINLRTMTSVGQDGERVIMEERPRENYPPIRTIKFKASSVVEATEWVDIIQCLLETYSDKKKAEDAFASGQEDVFGDIPPPPPPDEDLEDGLGELATLAIKNQEYGIDLDNIMVELGPYREGRLSASSQKQSSPRRSHHARSGSFKDFTLAAPSFPAPSAPIPPDLPQRSKPSSRSQKARSLSSSSNHSSKCSANTPYHRTKSRSRSRARNPPRQSRSASMPPPLPPWPEDDNFPSPLPRVRSRSTDFIEDNYVKNAITRGVPDYQINNDIWARFRQSF